MMESAKEKLSFLLSKKEKYIQNVAQQKERKDIGMDQNFLSDKNFNKCCFCTKIFLNSKFLIKHIFRRHSENLVIMFQKLSDLNTSDIKDNLSQNDLICHITNEFSKLRNDLQFILSPISSKQSHSNFCHNSFIKESNDSQIKKGFIDVIEKVDVLNSDVQALRVSNAKIETDIIDLKVQWKECDIKEFCNSTQVKETLIYQTLKDELLLEIQNLMLENNKKQTLNLSKLSLHIKEDIERLEHIIKVNLENVDVSNLVQETLKSLEKEIEFFFSHHKAKKCKTQTEKLKLCKEISPSITQIRPSINELKMKLNSTNISDAVNNQCSSDYKLNSFRSCELSKSEKIVKAKIKEVENESSDVDGNKIPLLLEMKLNALNIPDGTKRLSNTDYASKMKLVESEQEVLIKKYPSFSDIYKYLSFTLDNNAFEKLNIDKKPKKIRFSLTPKQAFRNKMRYCDVKKISDPHEGSSTDSRCVENCPGIINLINISDMELKKCNSFSQCNSAASLKLISSSTGKRKLPNVPQSVVAKELSPYDSLESDF